MKKFKKLVKLVWSNYGSSYKNVLIILIVMCIILFSWVLDIVDISFDNLDRTYNQMKYFLVKTHIVDIYNRPKKEYILAFKIGYLVIYSLYLIVFVITFLFTNWKLFLYTILVYIFVKSLLTDFFTKHFKFNKSWNIKYKFKYMWEQRRNLISFIVKSWLVMLPIRFLIRITIIVLFNFHDNFISDILIVLLALPFYYYFFNIIRKYLGAKGEQRTDAFRTVNGMESSITMNSLQLENDYYLFNHYVIKQMNLYNMIYIIFIIWLMKYYFFYCLIFMFIILVLMIDIVLYRYLFSAKASVYTSKDMGMKKELLAVPPVPVLTYTLACIHYNLGAYLSWSAMVAHNRPESVQSPENETFFDLLETTNEYGPCKKAGVISSKYNTNKLDKPSIDCFNWYHDNAQNGGVDVTMWPLQDDIAHAQIANSPILRMVYAQKETVHRHPLLRRDVGNLTYEPLTTFKSERFIGSLGKIKNTLVINLLELKRSSAYRHFLPTHFVQDESLRHVNSHLEPVRETLKFFEDKYGMIIPYRDEIYNIITITETQPYGGNNPPLEKFLRPYHLFSDLSTMYTSEEHYYLTKNKIIEDLP